MTDKFDHKNDLIDSLSRLTNISTDVLQNYANKGNVLNVLEHPNVINLDEEQLEKIRLLNQFYASYRVLQLIESNLKVNLGKPHEAGEYFLSLMSTMKDREMFIVAFLDNGNNLIESRVIAQGSVDFVLINPRDVVKYALNCDCKSVIFAHNHPGGNRKFSEEDISLTVNLINALRPLGIRVFDHFVIANYSYTSMQETGRFPTVDTAVPSNMEVTTKDYPDETLYDISFVTHKEAVQIIEIRSPKGKFIELDYSGEKATWIAIDNSREDAWTESFTSLEKACHYLIGENRFIDIQPDIEKKAEQYLNNLSVERSRVFFSAWMADKVSHIDKESAAWLIKSGAICVVDVYGVDDQEHESLLEEQNQLNQYEIFVIEKGSLSRLDCHVPELMRRDLNNFAYSIMANYIIESASESDENNSITSFKEVEKHFGVKIQDSDILHLLSAIRDRDETAEVSADKNEGFYITVYSGQCESEVENELSM